VDTKKSFSLIELIIVVAIIGVLAAVVFVAAGPARKKVKDAKIESSLFQIQNRAEQLYLNEGNYNKVCPSGGSCDSEIQALYNEIQAIGSSPNIYPASPVARFCAVSNLFSSSQYSCVDFQGQSARLSATSIGRCQYAYRCTCSASFDFDEDGDEDCDDFSRFFCFYTDCSCSGQCNGKASPTNYNSKYDVSNPCDDAIISILDQQALGLFFSSQGCTFDPSACNGSCSGY